MMRRIALGFALVTVFAGAAGADEPTVTEQAAEACEQPEVVAEFGHGSLDYCYEAMVDEINPGPPRHLDVEEDGSGLLFVDGVPSYFYEADTFTWNCATDGNRICGESVEIGTPLVLTELPRTR